MIYFLSWRKSSREIPQLLDSRVLKREALKGCVYITAGQEMTYFLKLNANGQWYYPNSSHILVENNSQIVQNSAVSFTLFAALFGTS